MRIGFLFNHDQIHQVAHSLPIALALAERRRNWTSSSPTTNERLRNEVGRIVAERGARPFASSNCGREVA